MRLIALLLSVCLSMPALAKTESYRFDKAHTTILFAVDHLGFSQKICVVRDFEGALAFDPEAITQSRVHVTLNPVSIECFHGVLNSTLQRPVFFDSIKFPQIVFDSTAITAEDPHHAEVQGNLTLREVTKPIVLQTLLRKIGSNPYSGDTTLGFRAETRFKRSDFGMVFALPDVGDEVRVEIEAEAVKE